MKANVPIKLMLRCKSEVTSPILVKFPWVYIGLTENRFSLLAFSWNFHMTSSIPRPIFKGAAFSTLLVRFPFLAQPENNILEKYHLWRRLVSLECFVSSHTSTRVLAPGISNSPVFMGTTYPCNIQPLVKIRFRLAFCFQYLFQGGQAVSPPNDECWLFLARVQSMSFSLPKTRELEWKYSPILKFSIHHSHRSKSQTDKNDRKSVKLQPPCI